MRVLQVIPYFTPRRGGDVNVCANLSRELVRLGHKVTIATTTYDFDRSLARSLEESGVRVVVFPHTHSAFLFITTPSMGGWLEEHARDFDVIHMHSFRTYQNSVVQKCARQYRIPYVLQAHGSLPRNNGRWILKLVYDLFWGKDILINASAFIAVSKEEENQAKCMGIDNERISVVYNGIMSNSLAIGTSSCGFRQNHSIQGRIVLYLGRIHRLKGIDFSLRAFHELSGQINDVVFVIAGQNDGYQRTLARMVNRFGLNERVIFTGAVTEEEKHSAFSEASIFVHTVRYMGGVGLAPLEAIMHETPVVVTSECGELIKEIDCGYVVRYGDVRSLTDILMQILRSPDEAKKKALKGRQYIEEVLVWDKVAAKVEEIYRECIAREGG